MKKYKLKFIAWFDNIFKNKYCWADCVSWAYSRSSFNPFSIENSKQCRGASIDEGGCYCGRFLNGKSFDELTKEEKAAFEKENLEPQTPPF